MIGLNIPLDPAKTGSQAASLETDLRRMIIGQDEAIAQIVNVYQVYLTGMSAPGRPVGNFLFLGPTGSGKTRNDNRIFSRSVRIPGAQALAGMNHQRCY